jgi:hypothetical protein
MVLHLLIAVLEVVHIIFVLFINVKLVRQTVAWLRKWLRSVQGPGHDRVSESIPEAQAADIARVSLAGVRKNADSVALVANTTVFERGLLIHFLSGCRHFLNSSLVVCHLLDERS